MNGLRKALGNFCGIWKKNTKNSTHLRKTAFTMLVYHFFTEKLVRQRFVQFGNFGLPFKTFRVFRKFSVWSSQNCLTIYFLTEISEHFWVNGKQIMYSMVLKKYKKSLQVKMVFYLVSLPQLPVETRFQCLWPSSLKVKCIREWIRVTHKNKQTNKQANTKCSEGKGLP